VSVGAGFSWYGPAIALILIACLNVDASGSRSIAVREERTELRSAPVTVTLELGRERTRALAVARDPKRHLMLRIEGIAVEGEVGVWEVRVADAVAGTLSTYGAEEQKGTYIASVVLDEAAARALENGAKSLVLTFVAAAPAKGTVTFQRLRLIEE
jgi:hypothetical protein